MSNVNFRMISKRSEKLLFVITLVFSFLIGVLCVKFGMDNSKQSKYNEEMLQELRDIKELLEQRGEK